MLVCAGSSPHFPQESLVVWSRRCVPGEEGVSLFGRGPVPCAWNGGFTAVRARFMPAQAARLSEVGRSELSDSPLSLPPSDVTAGGSEGVDGRHGRRCRQSARVDRCSRGSPGGRIPLRSRLPPSEK